MCLAFFIFAESLKAEPRWALMVEPTFMDHHVKRPVEGSRRTILTVARVVDGEPVPLRREEKKSIHRTFEQIRADALETASEVLRHLTPIYVRNHKKVILFAAIESENPLTASTVLAPEFASLFRETLGPDLLVAMPHRRKVYIFSRQDDAHLRLAEQLIEEYQSATDRVSREIFALDGGRLRSLGYLE